MMDERTAAARATADGGQAKKKAAHPARSRSLRIRLRRQLVQSPTAMRLLTSLLTSWLGLVRAHQPAGRRSMTFDGR